MVEVAGHLALATFVLAGEDDVEWALDAWRSLARGNRNVALE
jgi:hypothetical protein